jgi:hypothetical protein
MALSSWPVPEGREGWIGPDGFEAEGDMCETLLGLSALQTLEQLATPAYHRMRKNPA